MAVPEDVARAFGLDASKGPPVALDGGQGTSIRLDTAVLKPADDIEELDYVMGLQERLIAIGSPHYRVPQPLVALAPCKPGSRYIVNGWAGTKFIAGINSGEQPAWTQMLTASRAFHADLRRLSDELPAFIAQRTHRWARADRLIWAEKEAGRCALEAYPVLPCVQDAFLRLVQLRQALDPAQLHSQLVHGDLTGNFLLPDDDQPPVILDLSLYWHPVEYAEAVIVADSLLDYEAGEEMVDLVGRSPFRLQMLVRALLLRLLTGCEVLGCGGNTAEADAFRARYVHAMNVLESVFSSSAS